MPGARFEPGRYREAAAASRVAFSAALVGCVLVVPMPAKAAVVSVEVDRAMGGHVRYAAEAGEQNRLRVDWQSAEDGVIITDPGAVISAPPDVCTQEGPHVVRCRARRDRFGFPGYLNGLTADLLDLEDQFLAGDLGMSSHRVVVRGGSGGDRLQGTIDAEQFDGGLGDDVLLGGFGDDVLTGGAGRDELYGEGGTDVLADGSGPGSDVFDGGPAHDRISYAGRRTPVFVDLDDAGTDGARGERDVVRNAEGAIGGAGADRLAGESRSRVDVYGPRGSILEGGPGLDTLIGRRGNDQLLPGTGGAVVRCGAGLDVAMERTFIGPVHAPARPLTAKTRLSRDCERLQPGADVELWSQMPVNPSAIGREHMTYRVTCPLGGADDDDREPCAGRLRLVSTGGQGRVLARGRFSEGPWEERPVKLRLTARGRALIARGGGWATIRTSGRNFPKRSWTIRLPGR